MDISLDRNGGTALYKQLLTALASRIRSGEIAHGSQLPSVRNLAKSLGVSPITVVQAYNGLVADGLIHAAVGRGTFAGPTGPGALPSDLSHSDDQPPAPSEDGEWPSSLPVPR